MGADPCFSFRLPPLLFDLFLRGPARLRALRSLRRSARSRHSGEIRLSAKTQRREGWTKFKTVNGESWKAGPEFFNYGWTRINTDSRNEECLARTRFRSSVFICVHPWLTLLSLRSFGFLDIPIHRHRVHRASDPPAG